MKHVKQNTSVERSLIKHQSIFYVIPAVAHNSHCGVLTRGQLFKVDQLDGLCLHHGPLWIRQQVHQGVDTVPLVIANSTWIEHDESHWSRKQNG